jgi:hypothetical protein
LEGYEELNDLNACMKTIPFPFNREHLLSNIIWCRSESAVDPKDRKSVV